MASTHRYMLAKDYTHIYLDMDGTIADLYNVPGWLDKIHSEEKGLYLEAKPLITEEELLKQLPDPTHIWIVTMGPVVCSLDYKIKVFEEKEMWLKKTLSIIALSCIYQQPRP